MLPNCSAPPWPCSPEAVRLIPSCSVLFQGPKATWLSESDTDVKMNESVFEWWLWLELYVWLSLASPLMVPDKGPLESLAAGSCGCFFIWSRKRGSFWQPIFRFMVSCSLIAKIPLFSSLRLRSHLKEITDFGIQGDGSGISYRVVQGTTRATQPRHPASF